MADEEIVNQPGAVPEATSPAVEPEPQATEDGAVEYYVPEYQQDGYDQYGYDRAGNQRPEPAAEPAPAPTPAPTAAAPVAPAPVSRQQAAEPLPGRPVITRDNCANAQELAWIEEKKFIDPVAVSGFVHQKLQQVERYAEETANLILDQMEEEMPDAMRAYGRRLERSVRQMDAKEKQDPQAIRRRLYEIIGEQTVAGKAPAAAAPAPAAPAAPARRPIPPEARMPSGGSGARREVRRTTPNDANRRSEMEEHYHKLYPTMNDQEVRDFVRGLEERAI